MVKNETVLLLFAEYANLPVGSTATPHGRVPPVVSGVPTEVKAPLPGSMLYVEMV
jgi:hypothetical protein